MTNQDISSLSATSLAECVRSKELSAVEVTTAALSAMDSLNPILNAFCTPTPDLALATARQIDAKINRNEVPGPMAGVPIGIKDLILTKDIRTTFGSPLYADFIPSQDDIVIERLRAAGAVIIGKTNAAEFGYGGVGHNPVFPTTRNPWDLALTPGGSSAGSAAAVAANICPVALGSDGGGSVRLPAALTGLVGFKPTMGRIPVWPGCRDETLPGVSGWESVEHYGPLSRTVADAALFVSVTSGPDRRDRLSLPDDGTDWLDAVKQPCPRGLKIAWVPQWAGLPITPDVLRVAEQAAENFATSIGAHIEICPAPFGDLIENFRNLVLMETDLTGLRRLAQGRENELSASVQGLLQCQPEATNFTDAITARKAAYNAMVRFMEKYPLLLTPTVPVTAFPINQDGPGFINGQPIAHDAWTPCLFPANLTGQPAISLPAGLTPSGLPVGLQIIGRRLDDYTTLQAAAAFEKACPWTDHIPPTSIRR